MRTLDATVGVEVPLVDPGPDVPVVPAQRRRPGVREDEVSRFGDLRVGAGPPAALGHSQRQGVLVVQLPPRCAARSCASPGR